MIKSNLKKKVYTEMEENLQLIQIFDRYDKGYSSLQNIILIF